MSTITHNAILSNTTQTRYGQVWADVYDMLKPDVYQELIPYYGKGVGLAEWAEMAGNTITFGSKTVTVYEEGSPYKLVEVEEVAVAAEGAAIAVKLADTEYDANGRAYLALNDVLVIPAEYLQKPTGTKALKPELYQVTSIAAAGVLNVETVYTCTPQLATVHLHKAIPNGTKLMVTGGNYANEAAGGKSKSSGWYSRTFYNSTVRTDWAQGGSTQSNKRYYEELKGGGTGIYTKNTAEASMRHTKTISDQVFLGSGITAGQIAMTNSEGDSINATGTVGVLQHLVSRAMPQYFTAAIDRPALEDIKPALESQGVMTRDLTCFCGSEYGRQLGNMGLDIIKEFSGGTNLMKSMGKIDTAFTAYNINGVWLSVVQLPILNDPIALGADSFDDFFRAFAFFVPNVEVTVSSDPNNGVPVKMKNLTIGYKVANGENRTRIVKVQPGMANLDGGNIAVTDYDETKGHILSEFRVYANKFNQLIYSMDDRILIP